MNRRLALAAIFFLGGFTVRADPPSETPAPLSAPVTDPAVVGEHYREVLARPAFQETEEPDVKSRFNDWLARWFTRLGSRFGEFKYANNIHALTSLFLTVMTGLSVAGLIYIIVRLTRRRGRMEPEPAFGVAGPKTFLPPEFYEFEIQQAIRAGDWHAAWLAGWRQFLSRLEKGHLVEADRTRTNREYLAQLRAQSLPSSAFALLTGMVDAYDRFIYGRQSIAKPDWDHFYRQINEAALLLHLDEKSATSQAREGRA
jgi:hypothetical protein